MCTPLGEGEHIPHLSTTTARKVHILLSLSQYLDKCKFMVRHGRILGHVSKNGILDMLCPKIVFS